MPKEKSQIIDTVKQVMPAVVSVVISKNLKALEAEMPELFGKNLFGLPQTKIPADKIDSHGRVQIGGGSGFIVRENGIILTNKHVIAEPNSKYTVITNDNENYEAEVLARDPIDDIAILKINPKGKLPIVELGDSEQLELGQGVLAIGNALGMFKNTVSQGIVSGLSRAVSAQSEIGAPAQELRGLIQTDAAINPGNSGGPLVNVFGEAIGINAAVVFGAQNINFAIPINFAKRDLNDLKEYGRIRRPLLGLRYVIVNPSLKTKFGLAVDYGAFIIKEPPFQVAIVPKSPADRAGLKEKDVVLEWNGEKITAEKSVQDYLENCSVGENVKLKVLRGRKELELKVVLAERK